MTMKTSIKARLGGFFVAKFPTIARFASVVRTLIWNADTTTFRLIFALSSLSIAGFMLLHPSSFDHQGFALMRRIAAPQLWALLFAAHWALITWRFLDPKPRVRISLTINCYGFAIWMLYVVLQDLSLGYFAVNSSAERILVIFSFWTIVRTGTRYEAVSP